MRKKAIIIVSLVSEANEVGNIQIMREIEESLKCDWLAEIKAVGIEPRTEKHCILPSDKSVKIYG